MTTLMQAQRRCCRMLLCVLALPATSAVAHALWPPSQTTAPTSAPTPPAIPATTDLVTTLETIRQKHHLPALGCAIVRHGELAASAVTGQRKLDAEPFVTLDDQWHLGSDTKAMTATLLGLLIEQGKLSWDTTLAEVFPDLRPTMDPAYRDVTVEQLLWHCGGLPTDLDEGGLWQKLLERQGSPTDQRRTLLEGVLMRPPAAAPGTKFIYSNAGYAIAGAIAEKTTGRPWEELMQTMLFEPLGMTSAGFGAPDSPTPSAAPAASEPAAPASIVQPWGHRPGLLGGFTPVPPGPLADNPPAIGPAGTVHCSLADWARFVSLHLRGARNELTPAQSRLIKAETIHRLQTPPQGPQTPPDAEYACGWGVLNRPWGGRVLTHAGSNTMWYAVVWLAPEKGFAILVTTNAGGPAAEQACDQVASALIEDLSVDGN